MADIDEQREYDPAVLIPLPERKWDEHRRACKISNCQICSHIAQEELEYELARAGWMEVPDDTPAGYDAPLNVACPQCGGQGFAGDGQGGFGPTCATCAGRDSPVLD
jgi:hypothetical protein